MIEGDGKKEERRMGKDRWRGQPNDEGKRSRERGSREGRRDARMSGRRDGWDIEEVWE